MEIQGFFEALRESPLLQRALLAGGLAGGACACLSPLVVVKRMAFAGDGLAHAALGGIGLAMFAMPSAAYDDWMVQAATLLFTLCVGLWIGRAARKREAESLAEDSAIGIAFSASMAMGALLLALRHKTNPQYVPGMDSYLFGNLAGISKGDLGWVAAAATGVALMNIFMRKELLFYAYDATLAEVSGLNMRLTHYLFFVLLALTIFVTSRVAGIVLASASLVIPGVTALKLCNRLPQAAILASVMGVGSFMAGIWLAYEWNVSPGSTVVLAQIAVLIVVQAAKSVLTRPRPA